MGPPVVQDLRHMHHLVPVQVLGDPQDQVPVLAALVPLRETADLLDEVTADDAEMADAVLPQQQQRVEVGLEVVGDPMAVDVDQVLVAVHQAGVRPGGQVDGHRGQRLGGQQVVVVQEGHPPAGGHGQRRVGGRSDVAVVGAPDHLDPPVAGGVAGQDLADGRIGGAVVGDAQLPVRVPLAQHRLDGFPQQRHRRVVDRQQHADSRRVGQVLYLALQASPERFVGGVVAGGPLSEGQGRVHRGLVTRVTILA